MKHRGQEPIFSQRQRVASFFSSQEQRHAQTLPFACRFLTQNTCTEFISLLDVTHTSICRYIVLMLSSFLPFLFEVFYKNSSGNVSTPMWTSCKYKDTHNHTHTHAVHAPAQSTLLELTQGKQWRRLLCADSILDPSPFWSVVIC